MNFFLSSPAKQNYAILKLSINLHFEFPWLLTQTKLFTTQTRNIVIAFG